jgi:dTMP kinase
MQRGALVVLEGGEGVGKSTQIASLSQRLVALGLSHLTVREPGSTPAGDAIRHVLLRRELQVGARTEALLFMAARAQLVDDVIRPALDAGRIVLADRFFLSTYAYQIAGRGLDESDVRHVNGFATMGVRPDLTVLLTLPPGEGLRRISARGPRDRIEGSGDAFHRRVESAFDRFATPEWQRTHPECGPIVATDARGTEESVADRLWLEILQRLSETFSGVAGSQV